MGEALIFLWKGCHTLRCIRTLRCIYTLQCTYTSNRPWGVYRPWDVYIHLYIHLEVYIYSLRCIYTPWGVYIQLEVYIYSLRCIYTAWGVYAAHVYCTARIVLNSFVCLFVVLWWFCCAFVAWREDALRCIYTSINYRRRGAYTPRGFAIDE